MLSSTLFGFAHRRCESALYVMNQFYVSIKIVHFLILSKICNKKHKVVANNDIIWYREEGSNKDTLNMSVAHSKLGVS